MDRLELFSPEADNEDPTANSSIGIENLETDIWRHSFHSRKRVRHSSFRHTDNVYETIELPNLDGTLNSCIESMNYDAQWQLEVNERKRQSIRNSVRGRQKTLVMKEITDKSSLTLFLLSAKHYFSDSTEAFRLLVCTIIGLVSGLCFTVLLLATDILVHLKRRLFEHLIDNAIYSNQIALVVPAWIAFNVLIATFGSIIIYLIEPQTVGSGVPELRSFINGVAVPRVAKFRSLVAQMIGMILTPIADVPLGTSELFIYISGAIGAGISQGRASKLKIDLKIFKNFRNSAEKRNFVVAGAAAGFCFAFGTPLAAVLFMMEEMATHWNQAGVWRVMWTSMITSVVALSVNALWESREVIIWTTMFGELSQMRMPLADCLVAIFLGVIGGITGVLFRLINRAVNRIRSRFTARRYRFLEVMLLSACYVCCSVPLLWVQGKQHCRTMRTDTKLSIRSPCPDGQYNTLAHLLPRLPTQTFYSLVNQPSSAFAPLPIALFALCWFFGSAVFYGCNLPGGIIVPNFIIGAAWGRLIGYAAESIFGDSSIVLRIEKFALLGAASQLGGVLGLFLTIPVLFVEATQSIEIGIVVAVAVLTAKTISELILSPNLYTIWTRLFQFSFLSAEPDECADHLLSMKTIMASDIMSNPVTFIRTTERVGSLVDILQQTTHNGFPVVSLDADEYNFGRLRGFIERSTLLTLLEHKDLYSANSASEVIDLDEDTFRRTEQPTLKEIRKQLNEDDLDRRIIIADYMAIAPHVVQMHMSYARVYTMFKTLGLRHLTVVTSRNNVVGVITRKDLLRYRWVNGNLVECPFIETKHS